MRPLLIQRSKRIRRRDKRHYWHSPQIDCPHPYQHAMIQVGVESVHAHPWEHYNTNPLERQPGNYKSACKFQERHYSANWLHVRRRTLLKTFCTSPALQHRSGDVPDDHWSRYCWSWYQASFQLHSWSLEFFSHRLLFGIEEFGISTGFYLESVLESL